ncbi:EF hand family protein [Tritrichomonas foetus]|uniref:EF hand family protein n=1 Tax=Tritrichomonas foetus TaxID=1144522 RepID=A0A1J4JR55_9EUKA|nr:EF hand family protein [Tritrichomonas foetus]|eukprot:OHT01234.1 EF hand family protein [Tritrichomonas foetus]
MSTLKEIFDRFRTYIFLRDVHPVEWFQDFDKLNLGRITYDQFRRAFSFIRYPFRNGEFEIMVKEFITPDNKVDYRKFCDTITNIYTNKNLEKQPLGKLKDSHKIVTRTLNRVEQSDEPQMERLFQKMCHQILTRGVHVREAFMDFDRHNNGNITQSQFLRANPFKDLSAIELQLLIKRYADPILRDFNYRKMNTDLYAYIDQLRDNDPKYPKSTKGVLPLLPHQRDSFKLRDYNTKPDNIIKNFAQFVYEKRIRIREFFQQHDPLNEGRIPVNKFEGTLTLFGYLFTQDDLDFLVREYMTMKNYSTFVRWRDFCNDVDSYTEADHSEWGTIKTREVALPNPDLDSILAKVRDTIVKFRINALPTLQDFDRLGRGYISQRQFHRALTTLRIYVTDKEVETIAKEYENDKGIDFYRFIEDVDPTHNQKRRAFRPLGTTRKSIEDVWGHTPTGDRFVTGDEADIMIYNAHRGLIHKIDESRDIDTLLFEMQKWAFVNSVHFHDFLEDFDTHNINEIPINQFISGMGISGYQLTEDELDLIKENYSSDKREGYIRWRQFADDVIQFVAPKNLEKDPLTTPVSPKETMHTITTRSFDGKSIPSDVDKILEIIARFVKTRRVSLTEQFQDKDPMNHKKVSQTGFAQVLQLIGIHITKGEIDKLGIFYNDRKTNFIDYPAFIDDVYKKVGMIFGDRASPSIVAKPIPKYGNMRSEYLVESRELTERDYKWKEIRDLIQSYVFKRRIRLIEFFEGFDQLRHGKVTIQKFRTVIGQANIPLSPMQIDSIIEKFKSKKEPDLFNYRKFCKEVNKVFGPKELEKKPLHTGLPKVRPIPDPSGTIQGLCSDDIRKVEAILKRMKYIVLTRRMNIKEQFEDYDRAPRKNYITKQQFKQSIARLGLSTNQTELDLLCKKYRCTDLDDMNYHAFIDDIDN